MTTVNTAFNDEQFANPYPDGIEHHYWTAARNRIVHRAVSRLLAKGSRGVVLDIGCGRGITVDYLRRRGFQAIGCEIGSPKPISVEAAPHLFLGRDAFELDVATRKACELLLILDVLEHLPDPMSFLRQCHASFPSAKYILITVPARMELWTNYDRYYQHYLRYDLASMQAMCPVDLYELTSSNYFFHALYIPAKILAFLHKDRAVTIHAPSHASRPIHRLLAWCFSWEHQLLPAHLVGTSLMGILRRND
jgi:SAM-dependent methyltransferase